MNVSPALFPSLMNYTQFVIRLRDQLVRRDCDVWDIGNFPHSFINYKKPLSVGLFLISRTTSKNVNFQNTDRGSVTDPSS